MQALLDINPYQCVPVRPVSSQDLAGSKRGLFAMPFMRRAMERQAREAKGEARRALGFENGDAEEEGGNAGRMVFGGMGAMGGASDGVGYGGGDGADGVGMEGGEEDGGLNEVQGEGLVRMYGGEEEGVGAGRR